MSGLECQKLLGKGASGSEIWRRRGRLGEAQGTAKVKRSWPLKRILNGRSFWWRKTKVHRHGPGRKLGKEDNENKTMGGFKSQDKDFAAVSGVHWEPPEG